MASQLNHYLKSVLAAPVINFANPVIFPELFATENRWDLGHLNKRGAETYSRLVAEHLINLLAQEHPQKH